MKNITRIVKRGGAFEVAVTQQVRELGLGLGDYVEVILIPVQSTMDVKVVQRPIPQQTSSVAHDASEEETEQEDKVIHVTFDYVPEPEPEVPIRVKSERIPFDPSVVGGIIIKTANSFTEDALRKAIAQYHETPEHSEEILEYIKKEVNNDKLL